MVEQYQSIAERMAQMAQDVSVLIKLKRVVVQIQGEHDGPHQLSDDELRDYLGVVEKVCDLRAKVTDSICEAHLDGSFERLLEALQAEIAGRP